MTRKMNTAVLSFMMLYILTSLISVYQTLNQDLFPGELHRYVRTIADDEVVIITTLNIISFIICYITFLLFQKFRFRLNKNYHYELNDKRIHFIIFVVLISQIIFLYYTGIGKVTVNVEQRSTSSFSAFFAILKPEPFIFFYFLYYRLKPGFTFIKNKIFIFNMFLFIVFKLFQGWTSFLLILFFLEVHARVQFTKNRLRYVLFIPLIIIFFGGWVYQYAYVLKNEIRGAKVESITYLQGVEHLASRLSMNPNSLGAYQNYSKVINLYQQEGLALKESKAFLRPITPGGLVDKNFRNINNNVMTSYTPDLNQFTSSDFGIVMYYSILFNASLPDFVLSIIMTVLLLVIAKMFFDSISSIPGQCDILFFFVLFYTFYTVSLENVFGQNFIPYIFSFVIYYFLGGIKKVHFVEN
ncbi:putative membrane protein [Escherichia coli 3-267-03_S4_C2]|uniref:O-antigen polymerase n=1 Tax=Escherichia coli TaxID=562 RepID=A0A0D3QUK4_ECOLX|nr:O163 family O-antigen polymerase [Escherichia coli]AJR19405.1 O-antigen polymerase [Escherichia coli]KDU26889.1 putative membrane protein [Escherichia coli 3-267-03_S4_C2]KEL86785.1 putative membrane protein [Escherichia coli 5-366-08_S3_C2]